MKPSPWCTLLLSLTCYTASAQWSLTGNGSTTPPTNFLGTTDGQHLVLKTNNTERLRLLTNGNLLLGTTSDNGIKLQVQGEISILNTAGFGIKSGTDYLVRRWGTNNVSILGPGSPSTTGDDNFGVLSGSLTSVTTGFGNIGIGKLTFNELTTGSYNIGIGTLAGQRVTTGIRNVMIGATAGYDVTTGSRNIFLGMNAGRGLTTGSDVIQLATGNDDTNIPSGLSRSILFTFASPLGDASVYYSNLVFFGGAYNAGIPSEMDFIVSPLAPSHNSSNGTNTRAYITASNGLGTNSTGSDLQLSGGRSTGSANPGNIIFWTSQAGSSGTALQNRAEKARLAGATGNLLIGTTTDDATNKLQVNGAVKATGLVLTTGAGAGKVLISDASGNATWQAGGSGSGWALNGNTVGAPTAIGTVDSYALLFKTAGNEQMRITELGKVGIGTGNATLTGNYRLFVEDGIRSRKVRVDQATWSDYVFHPDYVLRPLSEVELYIKEQQHLPDVPSAAEVKKEGIDLGDNQAILLKKIEELTLYIIAQQKQLEAQQQRIEALEKKTGPSKKN